MSSCFGTAGECDETWALLTGAMVAVGLGAEVGVIVPPAESTRDNRMQEGVSMRYPSSSFPAMISKLHVV